MGGLRDGLDPLGHSVPLHQDRRGRRRAAGVPRLVRVALGAAVLVALAWRAGALGALRGRGRWLALYALFEIVVPFPLIAAGEQHVASSLAAIIIAAVPLFVALLALRFDHAERATGSRLVGLVVGLAGVVALVGIDVAGRGDELLGAPAPSCSRPSATRPGRWSSSAPRRPRPARRHGREPGRSRPSSSRRSPRSIRPPPCPRRRRSWRCVVLGIFCTAAAFVFFGALIAEVGPGRALVITYVDPVVAVALGVTVLGERPARARWPGCCSSSPARGCRPTAACRRPWRPPSPACARVARNGAWNGVRTR